MNYGRECLEICNGIQGPCDACGNKGMCCTQQPGWTDKSNGWDGTFGGTATHLCSIKKTPSGTATSKILNYLELLVHYYPAVDDNQNYLQF